MKKIKIRVQRPFECHYFIGTRFKGIGRDPSLCSVLNVLVRSCDRTLSVFNLSCSVICAFLYPYLREDSFVSLGARDRLVNTRKTSIDETVIPPSYITYSQKFFVVFFVRSKATLFSSHAENRFYPTKKSYLSTTVWHRTP